MNIKKLEFYNYKSHKHTKIDFDEQFYMILGKINNSTKSNGSGKSTIAEVIGYCYFGAAITDGKNDDLIHNDENKMGVMSSFELGDINYIIKRKLTRGSSPSIHIKIGDAKEIKYGVKEGQEIINSILGADFSIYKNTSYFKQGDINSFSTLTPKEAKEVVIKILQLDVYNNYEKVAKDKVKELDAEVLKFKGKITNLETQVNNETLANERPQVTDAQLKGLEKQLESFKYNKSKAGESIRQKDEVLKKIDEKYLKVKELMQGVTFENNELNKRIKKLQGLKGRCPTCEHELDENNKQEIIKLIKAAQKPLLDRLEIFLGQLEVIEDEEIRAKQIKIDEYNYDKDISITSYNIGEMKTQLKQIKEFEDKIKKLKDQVDEYGKALADAEISLKIYDELQKAFGKNGIQAYIIENVIPEIQATTNDILAGLDTSIRINIDSQKELKKGGFGETLNINVITPFGERPYTNYSGGEKTFIDFSLRIALSVILTRRSKCKIQTLILDEVFGELDTVNKRIISKALRFIASRFDFKKILIISHAEELQDSFNNIIRVEFDGETSTVEQRKKANV